MQAAAFKQQYRLVRAIAALGDMESTSMRLDEMHAVLSATSIAVADDQLGGAVITITLSPSEAADAVKRVWCEARSASCEETQPCKS